MSVIDRVKQDALDAVNFSLDRLAKGAIDVKLMQEVFNKGDWQNIREYAEKIIRVFEEIKYSATSLWIIQTHEMDEAQKEDVKMEGELKND